LWLFPLRQWVANWFGDHVKASQTDLTIFLVITCIFLLGLLIASRISYSRFRQRVAENKLKPGELDHLAAEAVFKRWEKNLKAKEDGSGFWFDRK
jgi:hypothetical protein